MSTEQEARRTTNDPPGQEEPEGPNYIARSVAGKAHWLQRVLSPWAQRWLGPGMEGAAPGGQHSQAALTVGNTQRLVGHVQRLVERGTVWRPEAVSLQPALVDGFAGSIVNRFPDTGTKYELRPAETGPAQAADLVLAGTGEPAPAGARPGGQSFQPFTSLAEFRQAIEAKQRASEAGPAAVEPPQASQPAQPQVQRAPAEPPKARRLARTLPPGSRPVSRVEEVLPGVEAAPKAETALPAQAEPQAPPVAGIEPPRPPAVQRQAAEAVPVPAQPPSAEEVPPPAEASPLPPTAGRTTPPAGPKTPAVQRQPEPGPPVAHEEEAAPALSSAGVGPPRPPAGQEVTPPAVQRQTAEVAPAPVQPPQAGEMSPAAVPPPAGLEMPVVQRQPAPAPAGEPPAVEAGLPGLPPAPEMYPTQRRVAEEAPAQTQAEPQAPPPVASIEPPRPPVVQRKAVEEVPAQPPARAEPGPAAVQRQEAEAAPIPAQLPREQEAPPAAEAGPPGQPDVLTVQRRVADEAPAQAPAHAGQELPASAPAGLDMPLVQRQGPEIESPAAPVSKAAPPDQSERPLAQRQPAVTALPPAQQPGEGATPPALPVVEKTAPAGPEMPLAQRQAAEAPPSIPAQPPRQDEAPPAAQEHEENEMPLVQRQGTEVEPPVAPVSEAAPLRQGSKMPSVQRQFAGVLPHEEEAPPAVEAKLPSPPAGGETPPARSEPSLVQRSPREGMPQAEAGPAQVHEPAAGLEGEVIARAVSRAHLPLIEPSPPAQAEAIRTQPVEQTAILPQARVEAHPEGSPEPPALTPSRPGAPAGGPPAQTGWTQAAASDLPLPPPLQRSVTPARPVSTTLIQRQPEAPAPSPVVPSRPESGREGMVQRAGEEPPLATVTPPQPPAGESTPPNLDSLARQIYPLIKRMLAVERERKWGR
jgi:hypothetical protein